MVYGRMCTWRRLRVYLLYHPNQMAVWAMKRSKVHPIPIPTEPGKWYTLRTPELTECCSCGLVHHTEYMLDGNGRLLWRAHEDKRATKAARKREGIRIEREFVPPRDGA